jgi:putative ABC transport system permease protein
MNFILNKNVGFDKDQVVIIHGTNVLGNQTIPFREELKNLSSVRSASISSYWPIRGMMRNGNTFAAEGKNADNDGINSQRWEIDEGYIPTMGLNLVEGRNFYPLTTTDSATSIVNQQLVKKLGLKNPIGQRITNGWEVTTIVGVVEDFHFETMKEKIGALVMVRSVATGNVSVKIEPGNVKATLEEITGVWKKFSPNQTIRYMFMDDSFAKMYEDVQRLGQIFITFAILAILVACLGLFALSAFMVEQRSKEISIRVVLGASMTTIFNMLTGGFVKLVIISFLIASPLAWWGMQEWLKEYQYKILIGSEIFIYAGFTALIIALSTVSYQSLRAAFANPAKNLRSE